MKINKCLILDDEQHSINILTDYIEKTPNLMLLKAFKNPIDAIAIIKEEKIDVAFIDVQMPNLTGLQYLKLLNPETKVILCTAYSEYAIDGYELNVIDYLLKPISFERFLRSISKIETKETIISQQSNDEFIFVKTETKGKLLKINLKDILFIEGLGNYQKIKTVDNQTIVCQLKMKDLEVQLQPYGFVRIHKSFMIALNQIANIDGNKIQIANHKIPIGDSYKEELLNILKGKTL